MNRAKLLPFFVLLVLIGALVACDDDDSTITWPDTGPTDGDADSDSDADGDFADAGCRSDDHCDDGIDCTEDRCITATGLCEHTSAHERCHDDLQCNGVEYCDPLLDCQPGIPYPGCNDHDACTIDICIEPDGTTALPECEHYPMDRDGDGHVDNHCLVIPGDPESGRGDDCDDLDPLRHPGAGERCFDGEDNDCDLLIDDGDDDCLLNNDTCASPIELVAGTTREGFTFEAAGDYDMTCDWVGDPDVVYVFEVPEESDVTIEAWGEDFYPYLAVQTECGNVDTELGCVSGGTNVRYFQRAMPAGTYYLIVKSWWEGTFRLLLTIDEPSEPPVGDSCDDPLELEPDVTSTVDIGYFNANSTISCLSSDDYFDVVYFFTVPEESDVRYEVEGFGFTPYVAVSWACDDVEGELACDGENRQTRTLCSLAAGTYFLTVQGSRPGDLDVGISFDEPSEAPENETCATATDVSAGGVFDGTLLCTEMDHTAPSCDYRPSHDVVYSFTLTEPQNVQLELTAEDSLQPTLSLQTECGVPSSELYCERAATVSRLVQNLAAGTYYIVVTGEFQADFELGVTFAPPTSACEGATVVTESQVIVDDNTGTGDTFRTTCGNDGEGSDVPVVIEVPYAFDLRAETTAAVSNTILHLRETCDDPATELGCNDNRASGTNLSLLELSGLEPGSYTLVVDSYGWWGEGAFTLDVQIDPVDTCLAPPVITSSEFVSGDSCSAPSIYEGSCGGAGAPETVTTINLAAESSIRAEVASAAHDVVLYLRSICDEAGTEMACDATGGGPVIDVASVMPGRYELFIDGATADACGTYEVAVTITAL